jgi:hypothetical protein
VEGLLLGFRSFDTQTEPKTKIFFGLNEEDAFPSALVPSAVSGRTDNLHIVDRF